MNYDAMCAYAGEHLAQRLPVAVAIGKGEPIPAISCGVYIAVGLVGEVLYVGSVVRPKDSRGVHARIVEHLRKVDRFENWAELWIVPLRPETPAEEVRRIEGRIGAHLAPSMSINLPKLTRPKR